VNFCPGPTSRVSLGHPSSGFLEGYWQALRLTAEKAAQAWRIPTKAMVKRMLVATESLCKMRPINSSWDQSVCRECLALLLLIVIQIVA